MEKIKNNKSEKVFLSFRIKREQKEKFKLLAKIKGKTGVDLIMDYVNNELKKPLSPSQIRKLPESIQKITSERALANPCDNTNRGYFYLFCLNSRRYYPYLQILLPVVSCTILSAILSNIYFEVVFNNHYSSQDTQ